MPCLLEPKALRPRSWSKEKKGDDSSLRTALHVRVVARMRPLLEWEKDKDRQLRFVPLPQSKVAAPTVDAGALSPATTLSTVDTFEESSVETYSYSSREGGHAISIRREPSPTQPSNSPHAIFWNQQSLGVICGGDDGSDPESPCRKPKLRTELEEQLNHDPSIELQTTPVVRNSRKEAKKIIYQQDPENINYGSSVMVEPMIADSDGNKQGQIPLTLDGIFGSGLCQSLVYEHAVEDMVQGNILRGHNTTVLACGKNGSGKSYSLFGPMPSAPSETAGGDDNSLYEQDGIFGRAVSDLLDAKQHYKNEGTHDMQIELACCEVFADGLYDLLVNLDGRKRPAKLHIRDYSSDGAQVRGLRSIPLHTMGQARRNIHQALGRRHTAGKGQTGHSHAIVTVAVRLVQAETKEETQTKLTLVDLASSDHTADRDYADKDLRTLDKIVTALGECNPSNFKSWRGGAASVPYRDSKLTRILRDSLGGSCSTVVLACVSPTDFDESMATFKFAERARSVTCHVRPKAVIPSQTSESLKFENRKLSIRLSKYRRRLRRLQASSGGAVAESEGETTDGEGSLYSLGAGSLSTESASWRDQQAMSKAIRCQIDQAQKDAKTARATNAYLMEQIEDLRRLSSLRTPPSAKQCKDETSLGGSGLHAVPTASVTFSTESKDGNADRIDVSMVSSVDFMSVQTGQPLVESDPSSRALLMDIGRLENFRDALKLEVDRLMFRIRLLSSSLSESDKSTESSREIELVRSYNSLLEGEIQMLRQQEDVSKTMLRQLLQEEQEKAAKAEERHVREKANTHAYTTLLEDQIKILREQAAVLQRRALLKNPNEELEAHNACLQAEVQALRQELLELKSTNNRQQELLQGRFGHGGEKEIRSEISQPENGSFVDTENAESGPSAKYRRNVEKVRAASCSRIAASATGLVALSNLSNTSAEGSREYAPFTASDSSAEPLKRGASSFSATGPFTVISNMESLESARCRCESAAFPGDPGYVEFYLPKVSVVCTCGHAPKESPVGKRDPYALVYILREWQVAFLSSVNITRADSLVKVAQKRAGRLAKHLFNWRKERGMSEFQLNSCSVAIHIWVKTCKSILRGIRDQMGGGKKSRSSVLEFQSPMTKNKLQPPKFSHEAYEEDPVSSLDGMSASTRSSG